MAAMIIATPKAAPAAAYRPGMPTATRITMAKAPSNWKKARLLTVAPQSGILLPAPFSSKLDFPDHAQFFPAAGEYKRPPIAESRTKCPAIRRRATDRG